jgi:DNA-binding CsgD family transcriptional regulator
MAICAQARGNHEESARWNAVALDWLRGQADIAPNALPMVSVILSNMASNSFQQGNIDEAERLATEALGMQRASGFDWAAADSVCILAEIALHRHRPKRATTLFHQGLQLGLSGGDRLAIARELLRFAGFAGTSGAIEQALTLLGASEHLYEVLGAQLGMGQRETLARIVRHGNERLGADTARRYRRAGQGLSIEDAVALALQIPVPPAVPPILARYGVTRREREVLNLMGKALTDQEIADRLYISRRTVNAHVANLIAKLGVGNRRQAVALARREHVLDDVPNIATGTSEHSK